MRRPDKTPTSLLLLDYYLTTTRLLLLRSALIELSVYNYIGARLYIMTRAPIYDDTRAYIIILARHDILMDVHA